MATVNQGYDAECWRIGDRVVAGEGGDRDTGIIWRFRDAEDGREEAGVGWDSGVATWIDVAQLEEIEA